MIEREKLGPWADDVPLLGEGVPKSDGRVKHLIEYLLTVHERFGNTAVTFSLKWGASALWKRDEQAKRIEELETAARFVPTHRHADGGAYMLVTGARYKAGGDGEWSDCVVYRAEDGKLYVTTPARWLERFSEIVA